jgi:hypothetical protein
MGGRNEVCASWPALRRGRALAMDANADPFWSEAHRIEKDRMASAHEARITALMDEQEAAMSKVYDRLSTGWSDEQKKSDSASKELIFWRILSVVSLLLALAISKVK